MRNEPNNGPFDQTGIYSGLPDQKNVRKTTHGLSPGDFIVLKGIKYQILSVISEGTGEAVVYKIQQEEKNPVVLKMYFEFSNSREEPHFETLERIRKITSADILPLIDFGIGVEKYSEKYCYEISPFAEGGDLLSCADFKNKYTADFIEKIIIPQLFTSLSTLHDQKIFHCDIKPGNIFFLDKEQTDIVLGDYGSAKAYDLECEKEIRKSSVVKGTDAYIAPEQARGIISEKNDYYSAGMVLLLLLYPEAICMEENFRIIDRKKFEKIIEKQYLSQPVIEFNASDKKLNDLIGGLTLFNHCSRWGRSEVERWLKGGAVTISYAGNEQETAPDPISIGKTVISDKSSLIKYLTAHDNYYQELIEEEENFKAIKTWCEQYKDIPFRKIFTGIIKYYAPIGKEYLREAIFRLFDADKPIIFGGNSYMFSQEKNLEQAFLKLKNELKSEKERDQKKFLLFQMEFVLKQIYLNKTSAHSKVAAGLLEELYKEARIKATLDDQLTTFLQNTELFQTAPQKTKKRKEFEQSVEKLNSLYITSQINKESKNKNKGGETKKFNIIQYFTTSEFKKINSLISESLVFYKIKDPPSPKKGLRCTYAEALLSFYLFFKYSRSDGQRKPNDSFSEKNYRSKIDILLKPPSGIFQETAIEKNEKEMAMQPIYEKYMTDALQYGKDENNQYVCSALKKFYFQDTDKSADIATIMGNKIYTVVDVVATSRISETFVKMLNIYNQYPSINYIGIFDYQKKEWYCFGEGYYIWSGQYYKEMKQYRP